MKVALLGCGGYGRALADALGGIEGAAIGAAYDPDPERAARVGAERTCTGAEAALASPGIEAVLVASPNAFHQEQARAALARGLPVFVEKPLALTAAAGLELVGEALERGITLVGGHNLEYLAPLVALRERAAGALVRAGRISFSRALGGAAEEGAWRRDPRSCPGGPLLQMGIHGVGIFLDWFGPAQDAVGRIRARDGAGLPLAGSLAWRSQAGVPLRVEADYLGRGPFLALELGTAAGDFHLTPGLATGPGWRLEWEPEEEFRRSRRLLLERFFAAARRGEPGNGAHALAALEVVERGLAGAE